MDLQATSGKSEWYRAGYESGRRFALAEADYDELAAIYRSNGIPDNWDIFRAEILNDHAAMPSYDFKAYIAGFGRACMDFFKAI